MTTISLSGIIFDQQRAMGLSVASKNCREAKDLLLPYFKQCIIDPPPVIQPSDWTRTAGYLLTTIYNAILLKKHIHVWLKESTYSSNSTTKVSKIYDLKALKVLLWRFETKGLVNLITVDVNHSCVMTPSYKLLFTLDVNSKSQQSISEGIEDFEDLLAKK